MDGWSDGLMDDGCMDGLMNGWIAMQSMGAMFVLQRL